MRISKNDSTGRRRKIRCTRASSLFLFFAILQLHPLQALCGECEVRLRIYSTTIIYGLIERNRQIGNKNRNRLESQRSRSAILMIIASFSLDVNCLRRAKKIRNACITASRCSQRRSARRGRLQNSPQSRGRSRRLRESRRVIPRQRRQ